jgi:predicted PurR-regulated permease PerM
MYEKEMKKYFALIFIIVLTLFIGYAIKNYIAAFFGALIFFYLSIGIYLFLVNKVKISKQVAAILIIVLSLFLIILPTYFVIDTAVSQVSEVYQSRTVIIKALQDIDELFPDYSIKNLVISQIDRLGDWVKDLAISSVKGISNAIIAMTIMFFLLYYLLINNDSVEKKFVWLIPFNKKNSKRLVKEFKNVTYSTVITSGLIAVLQGILLAIGFVLFGLKGAFFWGVIGAILSFLPVVGAPIIWFPAAFILFFQDKPGFGVGMLIWGLFLSNIDNFIRPLLQRKIGRVHPLITIIGIFIGLPFFGLLGLIIGPLLLSYFILSVQMFREEYLDHKVGLNIYANSKKKNKLIDIVSKKKTKKKKK